MSQIALFNGATGERGSGVRLPLTYNGLTLNSMSVGTNGEPIGYELNNINGRTTFDYVSEVNQGRDGLEFYKPRRVSRIETLSGTLRAASQADFNDKIKALVSAFDPVRIAHDNDPTGATPNSSFLPLDFSVPTLDTANYASGLVPSRYYVLPMSLPEIIESEFTGLAAFFDIPLLARDPRRYKQTTETAVTGNATINNSLGDVISWPTLTLTMSGAGNAAFTVTNTTSVDGAVTLTLNLSTCVNTDVVVVDFERRTITKNGAAFMSAYVSGGYFHIDPAASNVIAFTNTGNTTRSLVYRRAWSQ